MVLQVLFVLASAHWAAAAAAAPHHPGPSHVITGDGERSGAGDRALAGQVPPPVPLSLAPPPKAAAPRGKRKVLVSMFAEAVLAAAEMAPFSNFFINGNSTALLDAHSVHHVPGFLDIQKAGVWAMPAASSENKSQTGLAPR